MLNHVQLFATLWTVTLQTPLSMGFPRQENWSGLPFPSPGDLPDPGIELMSLALVGRFFTTEPSGKLLKSQLDACYLQEEKLPQGDTTSYPLGWL